MIIATACLPPLRRQRPDEPLVFVAREVMRPLLEGHPLLDGFVALPSVQRRSFAAAVGSLAKAFQALDAALLVHLHPDRLCQFAGWRAAVPRRIGYRRSMLIDWTLTDSRPDLRHHGQQHEAQHNFALLAGLGLQAPPLGELRPSVHLGERWRQSLQDKLGERLAKGRYVILNPTAYSLTHRWPPENFAWLARELRSRCERIVVIGERADDPSVQALGALLEDLGEGVVDLAGRLNLAELGWLLRAAALLVSRNTGTTHLAAAVGCPTVELFGRLEPAYGPTRWRSLGGVAIRAVHTPSGRRQRFEAKQAYWRRGFASIPRESVLAAAWELLSEAAP